MSYVGITEIKSTTGTTASGAVTATAGNALLASAWFGESGSPGRHPVRDADRAIPGRVNGFQEFPTGHDGIFLASAPNCAGGTVTCTFTCTTSPDGLGGWVLEYSGLPSSSILSTAAAGVNGSSPTPATASITNGQATALFRRVYCQSRRCESGHAHQHRARAGR